MRTLRRGTLEKVSYKPLNIVVTAQVDKGVVTMALFHRDKVKNLNLIPLCFKQLSDIPDNFAFRIEYHKRGVSLHQIWLAIKSGFACARSAAHKGVKIAPVLFGVKSDANILSHQLIFTFGRLAVFLIDSSCIAPFCRAVFLPASVIPAC